jgi:hypothetical protein
METDTGKVINPLPGKRTIPVNLGALMMSWPKDWSSVRAGRFEKPNPYGLSRNIESPLRTVQAGASVGDYGNSLGTILHISHILLALWKHISSLYAHICFPC